MNFSLINRHYSLFGMYCHFCNNGLRQLLKQKAIDGVDGFLLQCRACPTKPIKDKLDQFGKKKTTFIPVELRRA